MRVAINTLPLKTGHAVRGIGLYTRQLTQALSQLEGVELVEDEQATHSDIVHYPFFDLFFNTLPLRSHAKRVVTIHDVIPLLYPEYYKPGIKGSFFLQKQKLALKNVDAVITDSYTSKRDITKHLGVPKEHISVVPLASNPDLGPAKETEVKKVRKKYHLPARYVLYVGDINYNKNIPQLIKMLKFIPEEIDLVCVGRNFRPQPILEWQWIETQLALSDVSERVHFLSEILGDASSELSALYSGALCYVQPSLYEGFGLPVLEAMRCRTPVVASNTPALQELAPDTSIEFVEPVAEELARGVERILHLSKTARRRVVRSGSKVAASYSWEETAQETLAVYTQIFSK
ncbi:MAG: glycosyltransferase family 4 protein [Pseudomonadales bacterium]|nr:glycosyltransferase family 4 protein [Candidatus Woesebacteria bacterium]MCB9802195.1 glycosyltransferase family 4 protein [Pseudomonadales bacterium]